MLPGDKGGTDRPEMLYPAGRARTSLRHEERICDRKKNASGVYSLLCAHASDSEGWQPEATHLALDPLLPSATGRVLWIIPQDEPAVVADNAAADAAADEASPAHWSTAQ